MGYLDCDSDRASSAGPDFSRGRRARRTTADSDAVSTVDAVDTVPTADTVPTMDAVTNEVTNPCQT